MVAKEGKTGSLVWFSNLEPCDMAKQWRDPTIRE